MKQNEREAVLGGLHEEIQDEGVAKIEMGNCLESLPVGAGINETGVWECLKRPTVEMFDEWFNKVNVEPYKVKRFLRGPIERRDPFDESLELFS